MGLSLSLRFKLAVVCFIGIAAWAAQPASFEVVSLKPSGNSGSEVVFEKKPGGLVVGRNLTLINLVQLAWNMRQSQIVGAPKWLDEPYDLDARIATAGQATDEELMLPFRQLLAERCHFAAHEDSRPHAVFILETANSKGKLTPSAADIEPSLQMSWRKLTVHGATMSHIAEILSRQNEIGSPIVDKTGLTGKFDFTLDFFPGVEEDARPASGSQVTIFEALHDQLGLKLTRTMGSEPILVIDHIEKPTAN